MYIFYSQNLTQIVKESQKDGETHTSALLTV